MAIDISAVIPHYGETEPTLELVEALKRQKTAAQYEIIVSDDCSPVPFPETEGVTLTRKETNGGFGANVNNGVAQAQGEWVLILNSDLTLTPDFLEQMLKAARSQGEAMLSPQVLGHDGQGQFVGRKFPTTFHHSWEWFTPVARFRNTNFWHRLVGHDLRCVTGSIVETDWLMGACMMLPADLFRRVGGMDERFFMNSEEVDLQRRLADYGVPRVFRGDIAVEHEGGGSSGASEQRRQWVLDSRFIYNAKWQEGKFLAQALRTTSYVNFVFNSARSLRNKQVKARTILASELGLIAEAQHKKVGK